MVKSKSKSYKTKSLQYVTGFWKTDRNVTLGLFHFIDPANAYTHTLHIRTAIIRFGWLVCFSRVTFADPVNSLLGQWDPWRAPHGRHGCEIILITSTYQINHWCNGPMASLEILFKYCSFVNSRPLTMILQSE